MIFIKFRDFLMFYQIILSPQVKPCAIITYKHGIYKLPHKLPNDLRLRKLGNIGKYQSPCQNENFVNTTLYLLFTLYYSIFC